MNICHHDQNTVVRRRSAKFWPRFPCIVAGVLALLSTTIVGQPANDNFANATVLTGTYARIATTSVGATKEPGEPGHAGNPGGHSLWWKWTAPITAPVVIRSRDSSFNTLLAVYAGDSVNTLTLIAASSLESLAFDANAGTTYRIAVDGAGGATGSVQVSLDAHGFAFSTLAGLFGVRGSTDGTGPAARFNELYGVAVDSNGTVFVTEEDSHTVRTITPAGIVTTLAGRAEQSGSADGTGAAARFDGPRGLSLDAAGNIYLADYSNHTIRKITRQGVVTTFAGAAGIEGSADGRAADARFRQPRDVAVDQASGNVFVIDGNDTIRKITPDRVVTTFAGSPGNRGSADGIGSAARFQRSFGLTVGPGGELFVADTGNSTIRKITVAGVVTTFAGAAGLAGHVDGIGSAARFNVPAAIAADTAGNLYVSEEANVAIRKITPDGRVVTVLRLPVYPVRGVAVDAANNLHLGDSLGHVITKAVPLLAPLPIARPPATAETVSGQGAAFTVIAPATSYQWERSTDSGTTWTPLADSSSFAGTRTAQLTVSNTTTTMSDDLFRVAVRNDLATSVNSVAARLIVGPAYEVSTLAGGVRGRADGAGTAAQFDSPFGLCLAADGNLLVADRNNNAIRKVTSTGVVTTIASGLNRPLGVTAGSGGMVYISDSGNNVVRSLSPGGTLAIVAGSPTFQPGDTDGIGEYARFFVPAGITAADAHLYVAGHNAVRQITLPNLVTTYAGVAGMPGSANGPGSAARFAEPIGITADKDGTLFVADSANHTIRAISAARNVTTFAGYPGVRGHADGPGAAARFDSPFGAAVDPSGNVFVTEMGNHTLRRISSDGGATTLAGRAGVTGFVNGRGLAARFTGPTGAAVDAAGVVYVADNGNHAIRKAVPLYDAPGIKSPLIASGTIGVGFYYMIVANSNTLRCSAIGLPAGLTVGATTGVISGTPRTVGTFTVSLTVWNSSGTGTAELVLEIRNTPPPDIATQPVAASVRSGTTARFTVQATGTAALSYVWQTLPAGSSAWSDVIDDNTFSGATTTTLSVGTTAALNGRQFRVIVRDANGSSTTSAAVTLTITLPPPQITTQPIAASVTTGTNARFTVAASSDASLTYQWQTLGTVGATWSDLTDDSTCSGTRTPTLSVAATMALNERQFRVIVRDSLGGTTQSAAVGLTVSLPARLVNLSTRGQCLTADNVLIPGFVITGTTSKRLLIRVVGPTLADFGVSGALADPSMVLKRFVSGGYVDVAVNNDWSSNANAAEIVATSAHCGAFSLPSGSHDAVLLLELEPGQYTVVASGAGAGTGVAIVELYDSGANSETSRLANIATRGHVGTGDAIMIPGFVVSNEGPRTLLIRAIGPTLGSLGVTGALSDPQLVVYRQNASGVSTPLVGNDDWGLDSNAAATAATAVQVGAFALAAGSKDAAIVVTLQPGVYTVQASGVGSTSGTALVEVYEVP